MRKGGVCCFALALVLACLGSTLAAPVPGPVGEANQTTPESILRLAQIPSGAALEPRDVVQPDTAEKSSPSKTRKNVAPSPMIKAKAAAAPKPAAALNQHSPAISVAEALNELTRVPGAEIPRRIEEQRQILRRNPKSEAARQSLGLITVELGNRILNLDAVGGNREISYWAEVIRKSLSDTFWRTTQLAILDDRATAALGLFYSEGILTERDPAKGCKQYERAAKSGHVNATYQAALCKADSDPNFAQSLLKRAAASDHPGAQELIGRACIEGENKDGACAVEWLERAAAKGRPSAMSLLAWLYSSDPERSDLVKAVKYYRAAAEAGDRAAQNNLGEFYELGKGVSQDAALAFGWYARAAEAGFPPAQLNLARLYAAGNGVARNRETARQWAELAREQGQGQAQVMLDWLAAQEKVQ